MAAIRPVSQQSSDVFSCDLKEDMVGSLVEHYGFFGSSEGPCGTVQTNRLMDYLALHIWLPQPPLSAHMVCPQRWQWRDRDYGSAYMAFALPLPARCPLG